MSETEVVLVERDGSVARVVMNRPERRNAINDALVHALSETVAELESATWCRAVVLTGAGKAFCAGGDLADNCPPGEGAIEATARQRRFLAMAKSLLRCPKPTVAAVQGAAIGAGFSLALLCDEIVVHRGARLGLGFLQVGLPPDLLSASTVQRRAGWTVATDLLHTGRLIQGEEAVALKLVHHVVDGDVVSAALLRAAELALLSPLAFAATKQMLREAANVPTGLPEMEAMAVGLAVTSPEFAAATERYRPPGA